MTPSNARSGSLRPLLGVLRLGVEAIIWLLLIGGSWTYGWAQPAGLHIATALMLCAGLYVSVLVATGHWHRDSFPAASAWLLAGAALIVFALLQAAPWPGGYAPAFDSAPTPPALAQSLEALKLEPANRLGAIDPYLAPPAARRFVAWVALFLAALHLSRHRSVALRLLHGLAIFGFIQGCLGLRAFTNSEFAAATGTLYNRNHYGALMAMFLPLILASLRTLRRGNGALSRPLLSGENPLVLGYLALPVAFAGLIASTSRGALLLGGGAVLGYLLHQGLIDSRERRAKEALADKRLRSERRSSSGGKRAGESWRAWQRWGRRAGIAAAVAVVAFAILFVLDQRGGFDSLRPDMRLQYWATAPSILADHLMLGIGPGGGRRALNIYSDAVSQAEIIHFHNDWIEFAVQAGLIGTLLAIALIGRAILTTRRAWLSTNSLPNSTTQMARRGALWASIACLATALTDFHVRVPLVGVVFALTTALTISFGWRAVAPRNSTQRSAAA